MCLFCDIVNNTVPSQKIYEDEKICVFPDIAPKAPTHLLVIPKIHITDLRDIDSQEKRETIAYLNEKIPQIVDMFHIGDFKLLCHNGKEAGQEIFHLHLHILSQTPFQKEL